MELFIQIRNGQPHEHPIMEDNFHAAFPTVDVNNLPPEFARFERVEYPKHDPYEVVEGPVYQWVDNIVKDVWTIRPMTEQEKNAKIQELTDSLYVMRDFFKQVAQQKLDEAVTDQVRQIWVDYMAQLDAYVVTDPTKTDVPQPPRIDKDGNALTNDAAGVVPDVTG